MGITINPIYILGGKEAEMTELLFSKISLSLTNNGHFSPKKERKLLFEMNITQLHIFMLEVKAVQMTAALFSLTLTVIIRNGNSNHKDH